MMIGAAESPIIELETFYADAYALYQAGKTADAAKVFELLCARQPLDARFWFGLAASLQEGAHYEKALPAWGMCALLDSSNPYPHFHAAECATSLEKKEDALLALKETKRLLNNAPHPLLSTIQALEERWSIS